jgi:hypothetical protein
MRSWLTAFPGQTPLHAFKRLLPAGFSFESVNAKSGEIRWRRPAAEDFFLDLVVHATTERVTGFAFQTKLQLSCRRLGEIEFQAKFEECDGTARGSDCSEGILVSVYVEGLARSKLGGPIDLHVWGPPSGVTEPDRWLASVDASLSLFGELSSGAAFLPRRLLELQRLAESANPPAIALFGNAFVLAAEVAVVVGDKAAAAEVLREGKQANWSSKARRLDAALTAIAACKARHIENSFLLPQ